MRSGCRRGGSLRTLAWRAVQMEGPGCLRTTGLVVRLAPFGVLALWGQLRPGRSLVEVGSSAALRAEVTKGMHRAGALLATTQSSNLVSWPAGRPVPHASAATRGRATVSLERPRSPALTPKGAHSTLGPICSQTGVTSGHTAHPGSPGFGESQLSGPPRSPRVPLCFSTKHTRKHVLRARCGRARAGRAPPESIFSPH